MLDKPRLHDEKIIELLESNHNLKVDALDFMPVGNDQHAWVYRVYAKTGDCFLKLRKGGTKPASLFVPHELRRMGISEVVAPLATKRGDLRVTHKDFDLILYPYIEGRSAWGLALTPSLARRWGEVMRRMHGAVGSPRISAVAPREVFGVKWLSTIKRVEEIISSGDFSGDVANAMAQVWREHQTEIALCRDRYIEMAARLTEQAPPFVLCHADIHTANIIVGADEQIRIVDWDETVIAPKERDLMFFLLDGHSDEFTDAFFKGYDDIDVNWLALTYYKYDWVMQECADYGERVFLSADLGERDLRASLCEFKRLFAPDNVIERAQRAFAICQRVAADSAADVG